MRRHLALVLAAIIPLASIAADTQGADPAPLIQPAGDRDLNEFLWKYRVIVVFADNPADPRFQDQVAMLRAGEAELRDRDVVVLTDADPSQPSAARRVLRPRGFQLALVDKDGGVRLRKPAPRSLREITGSIDRTPERQREVDERRERR